MNSLIQTSLDDYLPYKYPVQSKSPFTINQYCMQVETAITEPETQQALLIN